MKKYLVIGSPIDHSLSPELHNHWIKKNLINAVYDKRHVKEGQLEKIILLLKNDELSGINVTVPYKKAVIKFVDELTDESKATQSVNTIYKKNNKVVGDNTDILGFEKALKNINYNIENKKVFILGAGGVAPSIIVTLKRLKVGKIILSNRTREKAMNLKNIYEDLEIIDWGKTPSFDMIINATSLGLKKNEEIKINYSQIGSNKFFYDVIYNPNKTRFLLEGEKLGNKIENGKMMFIYQAQIAFKIWHNIMPKIHKKLLD